MSIAYRKEIDGLRAIAILPVLLFHAGIAGFSGGFVGVDIFFVISGFLITSIIVRDINNGVFSFSHFFERRIRRIFPALITVLVATLIVGLFILLYPADITELGKSIFAQGMFLSNMFFLRNENYFAAPAETLPLLHTWTLSLEEQFYIMFPLLVFLTVVRFRKKLTPVVLTVGALSFLVSVYLVNVAPGNDFLIPLLPNTLWNGATNLTAGFYILPSRAWELMLGALAAITSFSIRSKKIAEGLGILGLGAIAYAVTQFSGATPFPGYAALVPVLGSLAIIVSTAQVQTVVGKMLSLPIVVWFGLISYSLYLWHWPVLVFTKTLIPEPTTAHLILIVIAVPILLAWLTYHFIETPFKKKLYFPKRASMITAGLAALVVTLVMGYTTFASDFDARVPKYTKPLFEAETNLGDRYTECLKTKTPEKIEAEGAVFAWTANRHTLFCALGRQPRRNYCQYARRRCKRRRRCWRSVLGPGVSSNSFCIST